jgi:hypothetical protein
MSKVTITGYNVASSSMAGTTVEYSVSAHVVEAVEAALLGFTYRDGPSDYIIYRDVWGAYAEVKKGETYTIPISPTWACQELGLDSAFEFIILPIEGTYTLEIVSGYREAGVDYIEERYPATVTVSPFKPPKCSIMLYNVPSEFQVNIEQFIWMYPHVDEEGGCPASGLMYVDGPSPSIKYDIQKPLRYELTKGGVTSFTSYHAVSACSYRQPLGVFLAFPQPGTYTIALLAGYTDPATGTFNITDRKDFTITVTAAAPAPQTANISGKVTESLLFGLIKRPSTGAKVSIDTVKTTSTANGTYSLTDIPLGTYTVTVSKPWFETRTKTISLTEAGKTYTLDFEIPLSKWINMMAITAPIITVGTTIIKLKKRR